MAIQGLPERLNATADEQLKQACVTYIQHQAAWERGLNKNPAPEIDYAERTCLKFYSKALKALEIVVSTPATTIDGLRAKASLHEVVRVNEEMSSTEIDIRYFDSLARDVLAVVKSGEAD
jgi:hypothetical protein